MLNDGSISIDRTEKVGNMDRHYYCVVELPRFSDEQMEAFSWEERQTVCAMAVQAASTEALASLWAGKMANDPRVLMTLGLYAQVIASKTRPRRGTGWHRRRL